MTILEARNICRNYYDLTNPSEEDRFLLAEALDFLITETKDPDYMVELGGMYYEQRRFDLALKYYEMAAEYDNFRKRTEKEKSATYDNAVAATVEAFLPVADNFALAMASDADVSDDFKKGLEMIQKQLEAAFEKLRVTSFGERGEEFDPNLHNAVSRTDDPELPEDHITAVYQKGYMIGDRIIRHAMVQISN